MLRGNLYPTPPDLPFIKGEELVHPRSGEDLIKVTENLPFPVALAICSLNSPSSLKRGLGGVTQPLPSSPLAKGRDLLDN